ncbi:MAG: Long-chain-fatty-acid--CoA ligase FadD13 [Acidimicrobiaceae bacterium]|nr:Long-chain-fatty-acid--CoA ligase FadD13 [Acidimicrobiaceae bacterium]
MPIENLADLLRDRARATPERVALRIDGATFDYARLDDRANRLANVLLGHGVRAASRVAYLGRPPIAFFEVLFAAAKINAVAVPLNWRLAGPEILAVLEDARPDVVLVDRDFVPLLQELRGKLPWLEHVIETAGDLGGAYEQLLGSHSSADPGVGPDATDTAVQIYTSGTTGRPKGVMLQHGAMLSYHATLAGVLRLVPESVSMTPLPMFHVGGIGWTLAGLYAGCETVLLREADPELMLATVSACRVTTMIAVPTILQKLLASPSLATADCSSLSLLYYGGGPITQTVLDKALRLLGCDLVQGYGLTECPLVTVLPPEGHGSGPEALMSCGRPLAHTQIRIVDPETGRDAVKGEVGELWVRSPLVMSGYWNQQEATEAALTPDGWLRTGDAASERAGGLVFMADRIKDMIITGGENVYSAEVESVLADHPDVDHCAVIGVASARWTETVKGVVVRAAGSAVTAEELIAFCRTRIATYKCPTSIAFVDDLPLTASGKVMKHHLRSTFADAVE